ncbi:MAG: hypothetical protein AB8G17_20625 [Gammaproteobacteria bacterium]
MRRWFADPFHYVAGAQALLLGCAILALTALVASFASVHLDGIIDAHYGAPLSVLRGLAEGALNVTIMTLVLAPVVFFLGRPGWRFIDLLGTQVLARAPFVLIALIMLGYPMFIELPDVVALSQSGTAPTSAQALALLGLTALTLPPVIWSVYLMYRSFSTCADLRGGKAIVAFVIALIVAETLSKLIFLRLTN